MKQATRIFSLIAGIIATVIGAISLVGVVAIFVIGQEAVKELIKPIVLCVLFFAAGVGMLNTKGKDVSKLVTFILMIIVLILERFVWPLSIFVFTEGALGLLFKSVGIMETFAKVYGAIMYIIMACTVAATVFHIISMAMGTKKKN